MSSIRQQIVDAVTARFGLIASGYQFPLPAGVYDCVSSPLGVHLWRRVPFSVAQVPALAIWDTDSILADDGPIGMHQHLLTVDILAMVTGSAAIDSARGMMADIVAAVGSDPRWGGLATWTDVGAEEIDLQQAGDVVAGGRITLKITYRTPLWRI